MSEYTLKKISELSEYTVEPDANDLTILQHIVSDQTLKMKWSTIRGFFVSTSTASTVNANSTWNDNRVVRLGTDGDMQLVFDGTHFQMKNVTANSDIIVSQSPAGILTEIVRLKGANKAIQVGTGVYINGNGNASTGLYFTSTETRCSQLFQFESKIRCQNSIIMGTNIISNSGNSGTGLSFDSNDFATFASRLEVNAFLTANSKILLKDSISYNGTGGATWTAGGDMFQTGELSATGKIHATGATTGIVEAKAKFQCNGIPGFTGTRIIAVGQTVGVTGGIITSWTST